MARRPTKKQMKRVAGMLAKNPELARAILKPLAEAQGYTDNEEAEAAFTSVLDTFGNRWRAELYLLSAVNNNLPRIVVLAPREAKDEFGPWELVHAQAGCLCQEAVTADQFKEMVHSVLAAHAAETGVAVWLSASNAGHDADSPGHLAYMVHANGTATAVLFGRSRYDRIPVVEPWWGYVETLLSDMGQRLYSDALSEAQSLRESPSIHDVAAAAESGEARALVDRLLSDECLLPHLSALHRNGFDAIAQAATDLLDQMSMGLEEVGVRLTNDHAKALAEREAAHAEELARRQRHTQSDKASAERITAGLRARITRLEGELKALRRQVNARPGKGAQDEPGDDPLGTALDRLIS